LHQLLRRNKIDIHPPDYFSGIALPVLQLLFATLPDRRNQHHPAA
jgi:hypothetical protein